MISSRRTVIAAFIVCLTIGMLVYARDTATAYNYTRDKEWLHMNILGWIEFGPAVLSCCKRIDLVLDSGDRFKIDNSDKNFNYFIDWLKTDFEPRLNMSENDTNFKAEPRKCRLILYPDNKSALESNYLLLIPLNQRTLNMSEQAYQAKLSELKSKMQPFKR